MKQRRKNTSASVTRPEPRRMPEPPVPNDASGNATQRWQRNVRFNWDNSGRRGGSNSGRR